MKQKLKTTRVHYCWRRMREWGMWFNWQLRHKTGAMPHFLKEAMVLEYARKFHCGAFVETGTYLGDMVGIMRKYFMQIYSIEIVQSLYEQAKGRFSGDSHIEILLGDSSAVLQDLLPKLPEGTLFWLDGHFSGGVTGRGAADSPIIAELDKIFQSALQRMVILIDDARLFTGSDGYPTIEELKKFVSEKRPGLACDVHYDIISIISK